MEKVLNIAAAPINVANGQAKNSVQLPGNESPAERYTRILFANTPVLGPAPKRTP
jgi:hypothetical protein